MRLTLLLATLLVTACSGDPPKDTGPEDTAGGNPDMVDDDGDGYLVSVDCDDANAAVHPGAEETCDGVDEDCDGTPDDDAGTAWYTDADGDGFGDLGTERIACDAPSGTVAQAGDCDDADAAWNPAAVEDDCADPADYNCDGSTGYADADGDGFAACLECDDADGAVNPSATDACNGVDDDCDGTTDEDGVLTFYADADGDGYGDAAVTASGCEAPVGYVTVAGDCDDTDVAYNPGAAEDCATPTDLNCDGSVGYADADGDGFAACQECDDGDALVNPGAIETCGGGDEDCDGTIDEDDAADAPTWYLDADEDGYGRASRSAISCEAPLGYVAAAAGEDCDDLEAAVSPTGVETCDGVDQDCDGTIDEDAGDPATFYADADGDGFGDSASTLAACDAPDGFVANAEDCDDRDALANPDAREVCGGGDENCDGEVDEDAADPRVWYVDADGDGTGNAAYTLLQCDEPAGYASNGWDCDDTDASVSPLVAEVCNGVDDDCDAATDEPGAIGELTWYADVDADGYGDPDVTTLACDLPAGWLADDEDCDDARPDVFPGASEVCDDDGADEDCDGRANETGALGERDWFADADGDGYGNPAISSRGCAAPAGYVGDETDCDDTRSTVSPGATEVCDASNRDEDCNGTAEDAAEGLTAYYADVDGDGYGDDAEVTEACDLPSGHVTVGGDCDDTDDAALPGGTEVCDGADNNCDGTSDEGFEVTTYFPDEDDDGFGDPEGSTVEACRAPVGYRLDATDCDDLDIAVHPYAWEDTTNGVDDDCDGAADAADTTTVALGPQSDDSSTTVTLSGMTFPFCGTDRTTAYMISNGRVTFGTSGDTDLSESVTDFDDDTAIAVMWDDLNPASTYGGDTWYIQYPDAVGFYWVGVREWSYSTTNDFSAILFDDGRILLQYAGIAATDGMIGFSCAPGSAPSETDITAAMDGLDEGRWGLGTGTETMYYEQFGASDNDLDDRVIRLCGSVAGVDNCSE